VAFPSRTIGLRSPKFWVRFVAGLLVCSIGFGTVGISVPVPFNKTSEERFPCEKSPCGCQLASHCWDKCCCKTDEEKLAWAAEHNVKPPDFLVARVKSRRGEGSPAVAQRSCCSRRVETKTDSACCTSASSRSCCSSKKIPSSVRTQSRTPGRDAACDRESYRVRVVLIDAYQQCHGIHFFKQLLDSSYLPLDEASAMPLGDPLVEPWVSLAERGNSIFDPPDGPVPRPLEQAS
jgi:hypothetical protein